MITSVFSVHVNPWQRFWSFQVVCANDAKASPGHRWCLLHLCISGAQKSKMWNVEVENSVNLWRSICCDSRPLYPWADRCWFVLESFQVLFVLPHDRSKDLYKSMAGRFCPFQSISFGSIDASLWQDANAGHVVKICEIHFNRGRFSRKGQAGHLNGIFQDADALITLFLTDLIEQGSHWTNLNKQFISEATIARPQPCNFWKSKCSLKSAAKWTKQMQQIQVFRSNQMGQVNVTQLTSAGYISQKPSYWWPLVLITVTLPTLQNSCKLTVSKINVSAPGS